MKKIFFTTLTFVVLSTVAQDVFQTELYSADLISVLQHQIG